MQSKIVIINYEAGNIGSIQNMLKKIGTKAVISSSKEEIMEADKLILPGVGHFDYGMNKLKEFGLVDILQEKVIHGKTPILGICLGMQLMTQHSEEGNLNGFGWFNTSVTKFRTDNLPIKISVPHMGWNTVDIAQQAHPLLKDMYEDARFYFVHSYYADMHASPAEVLTTTVHGIRFASGLCRGNIAGVQFHPEKSHKFGMRLLNNFINL